MALFEKKKRPIISIDNMGGTWRIRENTGPWRSITPADKEKYPWINKWINKHP